jgi:hypothetical protein
MHPEDRFAVSLSDFDGLRFCNSIEQMLGS